MLDKLLKSSAIISVLAVGLSISYYFAWYIPHRDQYKQEAINTEKLKVEKCLSDERERMIETYNKVQSLVQSGNDDDAQAIVDNLSKEKYIMYFQIKTVGVPENDPRSTCFRL